MNLNGTAANVKRGLFTCAAILIGLNAYAQLPNCGAANPIIYIVGNGTISNYDPSQPWSATNPVVNTIPSAGAYSLAVSANLNGPGPSPTFYQVAGANYSYWDGTAWVNTGHTAGAVNPAGGGGFIYSLIGGTGDVYKYNGTGNATLVTTIPNFGSGPYDLYVDCAGNFYALRTNPQSAAALLQYDPNGNLLNSWTMTGPAAVFNGGGGLAVWNNDVYFNNQVTGGGIWKGTISGGTVNFVLHVPQTTIGYTIQDFGTCPLLTAGTLAPKAVPDSVYYCGTGPGKTVSISGSGTATWSVLSGPATITGSGTSITVTATADAKILLDATTTNACGTFSGKDTVDIIVPTATLDAGVADTFFGCGDYIDMLSGSNSGHKPWMTYNFDWSPASYVQAGGATLKPTVSAPLPLWFYLTATTNANQGACSWRDSVHITPINSQVDGKFGVDIKLGCDEDTVLFLDSSISALGAIKYKWNFNDNGAFDSTQNPVHIYKKQNLYQVVLLIGNEHCKDTVYKTINLNHPLEAIFSFNDDRICQGDLIQFDASKSIISLPTTPAKFDWNFGDGVKDSVIDPKHAFPDAAAYPVRLIVTDSLGCVDTAYHLVDNIIPLPTVQAGPEDTTICKGEKLYLPLGISAHGDTWVWYDGSPTTSSEPRKTVSKSGTYIVRLSNECGYGADTIYVDVKDCTLFFPNAFTPNGDGKNDIAHVLGNLKDVSDCEMSIFNRWGQRLFYTSNKDEGWDGTYKNEPQGVGTYYFIVKYKMRNEPYEMKGEIILVR